MKWVRHRMRFEGRSGRFREDGSVVREELQWDVEGRGLTEELR